MEKKSVIQKIKEFFTPGEYIVPESISQRTTRFYGAAGISLAFGVISSAFGKSISGMIYGIFLAAIFFLIGRLSYLSVSKQGYKTIHCECVGLTYTMLSELKGNVLKNDNAENKTVKKLIFQEREDENGENGAVSPNLPPIVVPYDPRFELVEEGALVDIYTTNNGKVFEFRGTRGIDPIIGVQIVLPAQAAAQD